MVKQKPTIQLAEELNLNYIVLLNLKQTSMDARIGDFQFARGVEMLQAFCSSFYEDEKFTSDMEKIEAEIKAYEESNRTKSGIISGLSDFKWALVNKKFAACLKCLARNGFEPEKEYLGEI